MRIFTHNILTLKCRYFSTFENSLLILILIIFFSFNKKDDLSLRLHFFCLQTFFFIHFAFVIKLYFYFILKLHFSSFIDFFVHFDKYYIWQFLPSFFLAIFEPLSFHFCVFYFSFFFISLSMQLNVYVCKNKEICHY